MKNEIILNNLGLIYKAIKELHCVYRNKDEFDEYFYAGLFGLIKASESYDENKGKSGYLYKFIKFSIWNEFGNRTRLKRKINYSNIISLNTLINNVELIDLIADSKSYEQEFVLREYLDYGISKMKNKTDARVIKELFFENKTQVQIAKEMGVTKERVRQRMNSGLKALKTLLKKDL